MRLTSQLDAWADFGQRKGVHWRGRPAVIGSELTGTVSGRLIRATVSAAPASRPHASIELRVVVEIRASLPRGLELVYNPRLVPIGYELVSPGAEIWGRGLMVQREHLGWLREVLSEGDLLDQLGRFMAQLDGRLSQGQLEVFFPEVPSPETVIPPLIALSERIQRAWEVRWRALAAELGLAFRPMDRHGQWRLTGTWAEVPVTAQFSRRELILTARIAGVPGGLLVASREGRRGGERSGNPLLDHLLHIERPHPCLQDADLAGALLAAIHPHPGATLDASGLRIPAPTDADLRALLQLVAEVQQRLSPP